MKSDGVREHNLRRKIGYIVYALLAVIMFVLCIFGIILGAAYAFF